MLLRSKVYKGGKVVIPAPLRKELHLKEGEEVIFNIKNKDIVLSPLKCALEKVRQTVSKYYPENESLVDKLIQTRREEAKHE